MGVLAGWNYTMGVDSPGATLFQAFLEIFHEKTFGDEFSSWDLAGEHGYVSHALLEYLVREDSGSAWFDNISTIAVETRDGQMIAAFRLAVEKLAEFFGHTNLSLWRWGDLHKRQFPSLAGIAAFSSPEYDAPGTGHTVNPAYGSIWKNGRIQKATAFGGASERWILDFSDLNNSRSVIPAGQRGISTSPHYTDQLQLFLRGEYHPHYFGAQTAAEFLPHWIESTLILKAGGL